MNKEIFKTERQFAVWGYTVSHGQLLLRSDKRAGHINNIDIIFFDTGFVKLFTRLSGLTIRMIDKKIINYNDSVINYLGYERNNLFEIESQNQKYYIAAAFVKVFENDLDHFETSLGYENKERQKQIAGSI